MSMAFFLNAFTPEHIEEMEQNHDLVDEWVSHSLISTDLETAWDVLDTILNGAGFQISSSAEAVLSTGCHFVYANVVKQQAEKLSQYTNEQVLATLRNLNPTSDLYHQTLWQENEAWLLEQFDKLAAFYKEAAEKNLAVLFYVA